AFPKAGNHREQLHKNFLGDVRRLRSIAVEEVEASGVHPVFVGFIKHTKGIAVATAAGLDDFRTDFAVRHAARNLTPPQGLTDTGRGSAIISRIDSAGNRLAWSRA